MEYIEPSTSSAAATSQPATAEPAATGPEDGQETLSGLKDMLNSSNSPREERMEGDNVPKKSSRIRFRKKPKQPKKQSSKGLCLHYVWSVTLEV